MERSETQNFADFLFKFLVFGKLLNSKFVFFSTHQIPALVSNELIKNLGPIGSAVLSFIEYKLKDKQTINQVGMGNDQLETENLLKNILTNYFSVFD